MISANPGGINSEDGVAVTMSAFSNALGHWSAYLLGFAVLLFAFASILAWGSYGAACITYLLSLIHILAASLFHYRELTVKQVKEHLAQHGIPVRRIREVLF